MSENRGKQMMSESKFFMGYSRFMENAERYETWDESVERVMNMHREKYNDVMTDELEELIQFAEEQYKNKNVLGSQRALQFGGDQIFKHEMRLYNCSYSHVDRARFFQDCMMLLLCGAGVGFSVQKHHVAQLPKVKKRYDKKSKVHTVSDDIEGWSNAFGVLLSSYFEDGGTFPEYKGCQVHFDYSNIRPKGSYISGGFKAPGPDGLRQSLQRCEDILNEYVRDTKEALAMKPIIAYDLIMHMADAVLSGGVRRSATLALFSKDDEEMMNAKTGNWFINNPQRGRSNNSAVLVRDDVKKDEFDVFMESVKDFGEPGFVFTESTEHGFNPLMIAA